ncbi:MAG: arsenosugar biosynthesis radical SAM protein ArsS [Thermoplasmatota archaeon]
MDTFHEKVIEHKGSTLETSKITTLQPNITKGCNHSCTHCHHKAGPKREEIMDRETISAVVQVAKDNDIPIIDITGGAPEMNPFLMDMVRELKENGHHVMVRTNLTILLEEGYIHFPKFYRDNKVELIASLPCYEKKEVDCVRGEGVFDKSIEVLKKLNSLGYGKELGLNLVFNPMADFLPPPQDALKAEYKEILGKDYSIVFSDLFTITNMPVGRFAEDLKKEGKMEAYMDLLTSNFNPGTIDNLMCLSQLNIGWDGGLYDCDFNLGIGLKLRKEHLQNIKEMVGRKIPKREINTGEHCFGCTAGAGSSCGGALEE